MYKIKFKKKKKKKNYQFKKKKLNASFPTFGLFNSDCYPVWAGAVLINHTLSHTSELWGAG
jgi:hypothetical protein